MKTQTNAVEKIMGIYSYVTTRSSIEVEYLDVDNQDWRFRYTPSKWGSETNVLVDVSKSGIEVTVTGTTLPDRLSEAPELLEKMIVLEQGDEFHATRYALIVKGDHVNYRDYRRVFNYTPEEIITIGVVQNFLEKMPKNSDKYKMYEVEDGETKFILYPHICPNCGTEQAGQCWYRDRDGVLLHPDIFKMKFHVTDAGDVQV